VGAVAGADRRDGRVEQTERDLLALRWIGEQYGIRLDALRVLLGRLSPAAPSTPGMVAERTARDTVARWERAGLATSHRLLRQRWITPTPEGLRRAGLDDYDRWAAPFTRLRHVHAVGLVRLAYQARRPDRDWVSERRLRKERRFDRWHVPDAAIPAGPEPEEGPAPMWLVEVELVLKTRRRLWDEVLSKLPPGTMGVDYFTPTALVGELRADFRAVRERHPQRIPVEVHPLPLVAGVSYEGPGGVW
jgi:hypothetical protein